jgi:hypothetical protein
LGFFKASKKVGIARKMLPVRAKMLANANVIFQKFLYWPEVKTKS